MTQVTPNPHTDMTLRDTRLAGIEAKLGKIEKALLGNGRPGLVVMVDRHEQSFKARRWFEKTVIASLVGVVITTLITLVIVIAGAARVRGLI